MKIITLSIFLLFAMQITFAQTHTFNYHKWSDSITYRISPQPIIKGNTAQSDSMAKIMNANEVYELDGVFYFINSWADYYTWYVAKYPDKFRNPGLYQKYYESGNNYSMVKFIKKNFKEQQYPAQIEVTLEKEYAENDKYYNKWEKKLEAKEDYKLKHEKRNNEEEKKQYNNSGKPTASESSEN